MLGSADKVAEDEPAPIVLSNSPCEPRMTLINEAAVVQGSIPDGDKGRLRMSNHVAAVKIRVVEFGTSKPRRSMTQMQLSRDEHILSQS